jgi:hypothetical protein
MSIEENQIEDFDSYLRGMMSVKEEDIFLAKLDNDESLATEFKTYKDIQEVLEQNANKKNKSFLQERESKHTSVIEMKPRKAKAYKWIGLAASLLLLAGIFLFTNDNQVNNYDILYADNFSAYPNDYVKIDRGDTEITELKNIFTAYASKDYDKVIKRIDLYNTDGKDLQLEFYKANALMANKQYAASLNLLESLEKEGIENLENPINWYIALNAIKLKDLNKAKLYLQKIIDGTDNFRKKSAAALLEKL